MPLVDIQLIEGVFDKSQKQAMIKKVTDAMVEIEGEAMRGVTWVRVHEVSKRQLGHRRQGPHHRRRESHAGPRQVTRRRTVQAPARRLDPSRRMSRRNASRPVSVREAAARGLSVRTTSRSSMPSGQVPSWKMSGCLCCVSPVPRCRPVISICRDQDPGASRNSRGGAIDESRRFDAYMRFIDESASSSAARNRRATASSPRDWASVRMP